MKVNLEERTPIVEDCKEAGITLVPDPKDKEKKIERKVPCKRISGEFCSVYLWPSKKWAVHACPMADKAVVEEKSKMINPLKASKRGGGN
jgi:hypothetical protein